MFLASLGCLSLWPWASCGGGPEASVSVVGPDGEAALVELAWPAIFKGFQPATWLGWVKALPDELIRARPVLSVGYAWALLDGGEMEAGEVDQQR